MFIKLNPLNAYALSVMLFAGCQIISMLPQYHNQNLRSNDNNGDAESNGHNHENKSVNVSTINESTLIHGKINENATLSIDKNLTTIFSANAFNEMTNTYQQQYPDASSPPTTTSNSVSYTHLFTTTIESILAEGYQAKNSDKLIFTTSRDDDLIVAAKRPSKQHQLSENKLQEKTPNMERESYRNKDNTQTIQTTRPNKANDFSQHQVYYQIDLQTSATAAETAATASSTAFSNVGERFTRTFIDVDRNNGDRNKDSKLLDNLTITEQEVNKDQLVSDATTSLSAQLMNVDDLKSTAAITSMTSTASASHDYQPTSDDHNNMNITAARITTTTSSSNIIDMSAFLTLVSHDKIRVLVQRHYQNDPDVQCAYNYIRTLEFSMLCQHLLTLPEVKGLLQYFQVRGLDIVEFLMPIMNALQPPPEDLVKRIESENIKNFEGSGELDEIKDTFNENDDSVYLSHLNDIDYRPIDDLAQTDAVLRTESQKLELGMQNIYRHGHNSHYPYEQKQQKQQTHLVRESINGALPTSTENSDSTRSGLLGLIEEVIETLPQDIVLAAFFDKLETDEQFSQLIHSFSEPHFHQLINNFNKSLTLRHFVMVLQNHRIPVMDILDLLRSYFFLGSF